LFPGRNLNVKCGFAVAAQRQIKMAALQLAAAVGVLFERTLSKLADLSLTASATGAWLRLAAQCTTEGRCDT
jgi:hypothetical protein